MKMILKNLQTNSEGQSSAQREERDKLTCCAIAFMKLLSRLETSRIFSESDDFFETISEVLILENEQANPDSPDCDIERALTREKP